jgi:hypothetical protein
MLFGRYSCIHLDDRKSDAGAVLEEAQAHLYFTHIIRGDSTQVGHACWLGETAIDCVDIYAGETKQILLAVFDPESDKAFAFGTRLIDRNHDDETDRFKINPLRLSSYKVEVVLTWGAGPAPKKRMLTVEVDLNELGNRARLRSRSEWLDSSSPS